MFASHRCTGPVPCPRLSVASRKRGSPIKQKRHIRCFCEKGEWMVNAPLGELMEQASAIRDQRAVASEIVTFSPKVFLPVTRLCRDTCGYCTFAQPPRPGQRAFMHPEEVLSTARAGQAAGCSEALITVGDKPELKHEEAMLQLHELGFESTIDYIVHMCHLLLEHTELLPHVNAGVVTKDQLAKLRRVSVSQGLMLETTAASVMEPGGAHHGCPDKAPQLRLEVIRTAGVLQIPFTTGLLLGIGESPEDRLSDLETLAQLHEEHGHVQELIIQNFRAKPGTAMAHHAEPSPEEHLRTIAMARIIFGPTMNIQAPPNLSFDGRASPQEQSLSWQAIIHAGANDFGGISPVTRDWVNPGSRWPQLHALAAACTACSRLLLPRLPVYPEYLQEGTKWLDASPLPRCAAETPTAVAPHGEPLTPGSAAAVSALGKAMACADAAGYARASTWYAGQADTIEVATEASAQQELLRRLELAGGAVQTASSTGTQDRATPVPPERQARWAVRLGTDGALAGCEQPPVTERVQAVLDKLARVRMRLGGGADGEGLSGTGGGEVGVEDVEVLLGARGASAEAVVRLADELRAGVCGDRVTYVVNRNINYTNVCTYGCAFCAFSKGRRAEGARDAAYLLPLQEIQRRVAEAWDRGATEVCLQGGIHPDFTGDTYLEILRACKAAAPDIHVHAFSPLEVHHGASTLGMPVPQYLQQLRDAGLGSLPGTAAEVLTERVRSVICPDKLSVQEWLSVVADAHNVGLHTTSTIMFGHVDAHRDWAEHLLALKELQRSTGGITEFVPLPFVHMEAPMFRKGLSRRGPTLHEAVMLHAVARLVLWPDISNIQASWVKMGPEWAAQLLNAGCNDMGGSIMNESITRAAGARHGQELSPEEMQEIIYDTGRLPAQRTTLYGVAPDGQVSKSFAAQPLMPL
eukprot:jgi/Ulvmu1/4565/UM002_0293.1